MPIPMPFALHVSDDDLADLRARLACTRFSDQAPDTIMDTIETGVPTPKKHTRAMPPFGGAKLSQADVAAVADYVWALGHKNAQR